MIRYQEFVALFPLPDMRYLHKRKQNTNEERKHKYVNKARERERQNPINGLKTIMNDFLISVTLCVSALCVSKHTIKVVHGNV